MAVDVGTTLAVGGRGVNVAVGNGDEVTGTMVGVDRAASGGAIAPHAEATIKNANAMIRFIVTLIYSRFRISARFSSYSTSLIK